MPRIAILFLSLLPSILYAQKQKQVAGYLVYVLGKDTTMAGHFSLKDHSFEMEVVSRPNLSVSKIKGKLFTNGEIMSAEGYSYKPVSSKDSQLLVTYKLFVRNDSTFIEQQQTGRPVVHTRFAGRGVTANGLGVSFRYFLPLWTAYAPARTGDSIVSGHLVLGMNKKWIIKRKSKDQLYVGSTVAGMMTMHLDKKGLVKTIDAMGSSWNVMGYVSDELDLKKMTERFLFQEQNNTGIAVINVPDSVQASVSNKNIKIIYSRPKVRDRIIFGNVVPWDRFWRTGANAATKFITDMPLLFGDKELPAGSYSIWTIPTQKGWTMMFNSQANIWGTEYDPAFDVLHVPMQSEPIKDLVELFTIEIKQNGDGGEINVLWEKTKAFLRFH